MLITRSNPVHTGNGRGCGWAKVRSAPVIDMSPDIKGIASPCAHQINLLIDNNWTRISRTERPIAGRKKDRISARGGIDRRLYAGGFPWAAGGAIPAPVCPTVCCCRVDAPSNRYAEVLPLG